MAEDTPPIDEMHYEALAQDALRGVVRAALERAASPGGIPGEHHFYITFKTRGKTEIKRKWGASVARRPPGPA